MTTKNSIPLIALLLASGVASAQQLPCAPQLRSRSESAGKCKAPETSFLVAAAQTQPESMPGMKVPIRHQHQTTPPAPQAAPPGTPGMQTPKGAEPAIQQQQQAAPEMQMGTEHMEMRSPKDIASDVSAVQEPEAPGQQTGSNLPVVDLLVEVRKAAPKKLEEFEQLAVKSNPTLKQSEALVRSSAGLARQAGLWPNPTVGYEGAEIRGGEFGGGEHGGFIQQNIVLGGKLGLRRNVFEQQRKADELGVSEQKLNILGGVRIQFYSALAAQESVAVRRRILHLLMDAAATVYQLANVGQADAPDVLQTEVEAEQAKLDFDSAQRHYIQAYKMLAAIAGQPEMPLAMLDGDLEHPPEINPEQIVSSILANSPSVKRAEQQARQAEAVLKRDRREAIPDLTVRIGGQQNFEQTSAGRAAGYESLATASIQVPIFNRNQGSVEASKAELERAQAEVARIKLSLAQQAQPLIQQYMASKLQVERYRTQMLPRAQRAYELYLNKYRNMGAAYPEVLISQRTFFQLQESYINTLGELWTTSQQLQNYLLTNGLTSSSPSGGARSTEINLPTGGPGGQ